MSRQDFSLPASELSAGDVIRGNFVVVRVDPTTSTSRRTWRGARREVPRVKVTGIRATGAIAQNWADELDLEASQIVHGTRAPEGE